MMTKRVINEVQDYLTVVSGENVYQIVKNVELLLRRHSGVAVIAFLDQLRSEYKKELGQLIKTDKTSAQINELVVKNFRLKMAINTLRNAKEVRKIA
ncbi:MAG: hypothetical protein GY786_02195 [Proteobacteria bacterium]|nr:hypothetical protein [Pseudomonadota bacterium]